MEIMIDRDRTLLESFSYLVYSQDTGLAEVAQTQAHVQLFTPG